MCPVIRAGRLNPLARPALEAIESVARYEKGQTIYRSSDPSEFWYRVLSGAARKCAITSAGSRRIIDFLFPQDMFGIDEEGRRRFAAEVVADGTTIARYPRREIERLADSDPLIARQIREAAFTSIHHLEARMIMLSLGRARERVCAFLLELTARLGDDRHPREIIFPMSRYDVADYLGMAVETVSRVLTQLRLEGIIRLNGLRTVRICDWEALESNCGTATTRVARRRGRAALTVVVMHRKLDAPAGAGGARCTYRLS